MAGKKSRKMTDAEAERLADLALEMEPDHSLVRAGDDPDRGFGVSIARTRDRASQLVAMAPPDLDSAEWHQKGHFLRAFAMCQNVSMAAGAAGWSRLQAIKEKEADPVFAAAWDEAIHQASDFFESELIRRAVHGVQKQVWHKGEVVGYETVYSDKLLERLLSAVLPEKYGNKLAVDTKVTEYKGVLRLPPKPTQDEWVENAAKDQAQYRENRRDDSD